MISYRYRPSLFYRKEASMNTNQATISHERAVSAPSGWGMLPVLIVLLIGDVTLIIFSIKDGVETAGQPHIALLIPSLVLMPILSVMLSGFFTLQPNEARVLVLFGDYQGTVRTSGFHWGNPFYTNGPRPMGVFAQAAEMQSKLAGIKAGTASFSGKSLGRNKISLRARTLNGDKLKVNDKRGNPIEIAAVVVWRVGDSAQA